MEKFFVDGALFLDRFILLIIDKMPAKYKQKLCEEKVGVCARAIADYTLTLSCVERKNPLARVFRLTLTLRTRLVHGYH
jgi:hypothetical protein